MARALSIALPPPRTLGELCDRAQALAGWPAAEVARGLGLAVPTELRRAKGWTGQLAELALGADLERGEVDFPHLGVDLVTLPVDRDGRPQESTWVCPAPLDGRLPGRWSDSLVSRKLGQVLFLPVWAEDGVPPGERIFGRPVLWRPSPEEETLLQADWEALTELITLGELWLLHGRVGEALQIRPKAQAGRTVWALDAEGDWIREVPRGFYLRARFTGAVLARALGLGGG